MRPDQHAGFAELAAAWRQKLVDDGFVDIEAAPGVDENGPYADLMAINSVAIYRYNQSARTADLYTIAEEWLGRGRWVSRQERAWFYAWVRGSEVEHIFQTHPNVRPHTCSRGFREARYIVQLEMLREWRAAPDLEPEDDRDPLSPANVIDPSNDSPEAYL